MKKNYPAAFILFIAVFAATQMFAQNKPDFVPEKGYWQLVSNVKNKKNVTVRFFNSNNEMIYEETLTNAKMNPERRKVRRQLYYAFQDAYNQWALSQKISSTDLIAKRR